MTYNLLEFMRGDGRVYRLRYDIDGHQGTQELQTQSEPGDPAVFYQVKNHEWERLYADGRYVYREADTSEAPDRYYVQTTAGQPGAMWAKQFMAVDEIVERNPLVIHYFKADCSERARGFHPSLLKLLEVKSHHTFASGITLSDVLVLGWLVGDAIEEHYYYAKGYGLVGWQGRGRGESCIAEFLPGHPGLVREAIHCLPPLGNLYLAPVPPDPATGQARGVDVSEDQGPHIDWQGVRNQEGVAFVFLRASIGMRQDSAYERNHRRAGEVGLLRGAYHYLYPFFDAQSQARLFASTIQPGELPPAVAVQQDGLTEAAVRAFLEAFEEATNRRPLVYTSVSKWHNLIGTDTPWATALGLWVAHYTDQAPPSLPNAWHDWAFWQHSNSGRLTGFGGEINLDCFNGDEAALRAYAAVPVLGPQEVVTDGFDFPCGWPSGQGYYVAAGVAEQDYFDRFGAWHTGEDWNGLGWGDSDLDDPVYAVANGVVVVSGYFQPSWGNVVLIEHKLPNGDKVWSQYAHLRRRFVADGDPIERGQQIGTVGKGHEDRWIAHLHFEIRRREMAADAWGFAREDVLRWYAHPSEFIAANRPGAGGIVITVEENDPDCLRAASSHWYESEVGHGDHGWWTYAMKTQEDCWAEWRPRLPETGVYQVMAFVPASNATTQRARYEVRHRRGTSISLVDQSRYYNQWALLGRFPFSVSPSMPAVVRLSDQTGEAYTPQPGQRKKVAFDAVRFVLVEPE